MLQSLVFTVIQLDACHNNVRKARLFFLKDACNYLLVNSTSGFHATRGVYKSFADKNMDYVTRSTRIEAAGASIPLQPHFPCNYRADLMKDGLAGETRIECRGSFMPRC